MNDSVLSSIIQSFNPSIPQSFPLSFVVPPNAAGTRLDTYLASEITTTSRSQIRRGIELGKVFAGGRQITKPAYEVSEGEEIQITLPETQPLEAKPEAIPLDIVYEDDEVIIVNKAAGMVTHPGAGVKSGTLANALVARGLRKGDRVAIAMRNLPEWPVALFGTLLAGGIATLLNAWWTGPELEYGLTDSGSRFAFVDGERLERLAPHRDACVALEHLWVSREAPGMRALE